MFGWRNKANKAEWAEAIYQKKIAHPENESDEKLSRLTTFMLEQHYRIIMESIQIVLSTKYADTRTSRTKLIHQHYLEIQKLKPFCNKEQLAMIQEVESAMKGI
ncbi:MAG: hypothetical protein KIG43_00205 [Eubacteriales bacterium]|nr:hypothetical protein [Eubacteriales bacterium]